MPENIDRKDLYEKLAEAESQIEKGEPLLDAEDVFNDLRKKYVDDKEVEKVANTILSKHIDTFKKLGK